MRLTPLHATTAHRLKGGWRMRMLASENAPAVSIGDRVLDLARGACDAVGPEMLVPNVTHCVSTQLTTLSEKIRRRNMRRSMAFHSQGPA
jgi:hypothetical protein